MAKRKTERQRQEDNAISWCAFSVWHFECADGASFQAMAPTEAGAFRVLNAERPGVDAKFVRVERATFRAA